MNHQPDQRETIVKAYSKTVWRIALSRTRREDAAEEVYQEVFLRYFRKERTFQSEEHRKAYLIRITLNCCKSYLSSSWGSDTLSLDEVSNTIALPDEKKGVLEALLRLPSKYRTPIELYYIEGLTAEECASVLKLRAGTFRTRLSRAKALLKEELKGENIYVE